MSRVRDYFRSPIPPSGGFSPYRFPGPSVHFTVLGLAAGLGFVLCYPYPWLWPLIMIFFVAGLYLGRDLAVAGHYNILLALPVWIMAVVVILTLPQYIAPNVPRLWAWLGWRIIPLAVTVSLAVLVGFIRHVKVRSGSGLDN